MLARQLARPGGLMMMIQSRFVFYLSARLLVVLSALHAAPDKPLSGGGGTERWGESERRGWGGVGR